MMKWNTCKDCKYELECFNRKANKFRKLNPTFEDSPVTMKMIGMTLCPGFKEKDGESDSNSNSSNSNSNVDNRRNER